MLKISQYEMVSQDPQGSLLHFVPQTIRPMILKYDLQSHQDHFVLVLIIGSRNRHSLSPEAQTQSG